MTFADAQLHPRWCMFEAPGGTNLRNYSLQLYGNAVVLELTLLTRDGAGKLLEKPFAVPLAPSGQMSSLLIKLRSDKIHVQYNSAHQEFSGKPGGAEILFDRTFLERRSNDELVQGIVGPVWFKLTLDVDYKGPQEWLVGKENNKKVQIPPSMRHFDTGLANKSKYQQDLEPGLRVISVDLGLRTFASCSVFELVKGKPLNILCFPAADGRSDDDPEKLWARHERSFRLTLPGEDLSKQADEAREKAWKEIGSIKNDIKMLKEILRLGVIEGSDERKIKLGSLAELLRERMNFDPSSTISDSDLSGLFNEITRGVEGWNIACEQLHDKLDEKVASRVKAWRRQTSPRPKDWDDHRQRRAYAAGKSFWSLEYLTAVRKLLISWGLRGRRYAQENRQKKSEFGTYASRLLNHINKLKEDRIKTGADLIVQAACGYLPKIENGKQTGWEKSKYASCRLILFEDLSRYRFGSDRPKRENSQLMAWSHRKILDETTMQAEIYCIAVTTIGADFSSRFHAASGAPGVRCRYLRPDDFDGKNQAKQYVAKN